MWGKKSTSESLTTLLGIRGHKCRLALLILIVLPISTLDGKTVRDICSHIVIHDDEMKELKSSTIAIIQAKVLNISMYITLVN